MVGGTKETLGFQAEVKQLLHLMVHSLYSNKEIVLRELVSNASDACDRLRFESMTDAALFEQDGELRIRVSYDEAARTLTVSDNGIGMSRDEVVANLGTIAQSGTREFFEELSGDQAKDANLIGQFGVGFYSSFIVAERVSVLTRRAGLTPEHGVRWESDGQGEYTIEVTNKPWRGTDVILHLRDGEDDLLDGFRLRAILRKYSDHITHPILMKKEQWDKDAGRSLLTNDDEQVNQASALWARPKAEITDQQYTEFYKHVAHDHEPPLAWLHSRVEGRQEFTQLLYIPSHAPFGLWDRDQRHGVKLYVRRVFIMDDAEHLMPPYLRFVRGVVDSSDLPLNVSRELLQESAAIQHIKAVCVKKVLTLLQEMAEGDGPKYATVWKEFGPVLKEGLPDDLSNRERLAKLLRFATTHTGTDEQLTSLPDYVSRMKEGQSRIYYITADTFAAAQHSPHLEVFKTKGVEVLLLHDRVDEWMLGGLTEFDGKPLQSVAKGELDLGALVDEPEKAAQANAADEFKAVTDRIERALGDKAKSVRVTDRLTESPACLVREQGDISLNLERMLKAAGQAVPGGKPILEINPTHPIVRRLQHEDDEARFADWSHILFDQALLAEGGQLEDPGTFVRRLNEMFRGMSPSVPPEPPVDR
ncbi:MAG: molecular chaperone HtpG [Acidobacteria bacterium]|nr:molecular chaperone HtpG [Acidobacteriota bacterium]